MSDHEGFSLWMLATWGRDQIPVWKAILSEAETTGQQKRAEYARWILQEVLRVGVQAPMVEVNTEVSAETKNSDKR